MPALPSLSCQYEETTPCSPVTRAVLSYLIPDTLPSSILLLATITSLVVAIIITLNLRHRSRTRHLHDPPSPPHTAQKPPMHCRRPAPPLPTPTLRRSSYSLPGHGEAMYDPRMRRKYRSLTGDGYGAGMARRDTIEEIRGCRRHVMVLGRLEDVNCSPQI